MKEKFLETATEPLAKRVGNTISSLWTIVFGNIDIYAEKKEFQRHLALQNFKDELELKVSSIPEEKLIEPPLHVLGPTLEASKYYFESKELRTMFTNLIASSINSDVIGKTHPAFVEVIKQLSPLDAQNIQLFLKQSPFPIVQYSLERKEGGRKFFQTNVFLENPEAQDIELNASSITNLERLGLIRVCYQSFLVNDDSYKKFYDTDLFKSYTSKIKEFNNQKANGTLLIPKGFQDVHKTDVQKGITDITPFGLSFLETCVL